MILTGAFMTALRDEIDTYESLRSQLEAEHNGEWVLIRDKELIGAFPAFDQVAAEAVRRFGRGPYLIRQVGARTVTLPASVMYGPLHGPKQLRVS
jgi:hypothetical protein